MALILFTEMTAQAFQKYKKQSQHQYAKAMCREGEYPDLQSALVAAKKEVNAFYTSSPHYAYFVYNVSLKNSAVILGQLAFSIAQDQTMAFVINLDIKMAHRRKGYAFQAMTALEERLKKSGIQKIKLGVMSHNKQAQALYQKLGYDVIEQWRSGSATHHSRLLMEKAL